MRLAIIAPGSRGDVQPYIALGRGLQAVGHAVRLVTHQDFEALVTSYGLEFWPVEGRVQDIAESAAMRALLEKGHFVAVLSQMAKEAQRGALALAQGGLAACRGTDLIIGGLAGLFVGIALAEKLGLPLVQAYYIPFTPTRAYPSFLLPGLPARFSGAVNRWSYHLARQMMWQAFRPADRLARRQALDVPAAPFWGPFASASVRGYPVLCGFSPAVIPPPPDWAGAVHVTGYWFLDPATDWAPPPALTDFLQAGAPPVYVGFGSMSSREPEKAAELVLQALARTHQRGVLLSGWGGISPVDAPSSVLMVDAIPFSWLFPRVAAVVHHGGAGTTAEGLRAGVPSVVIPFFGDQPYWGQRVAALGVGPAPIPRQRLTAERLAQAIAAAVTDQAMRQRAAELGERIRAEDGVARATAIVERFARGGAG
ncbi:MAG: glycosyltransferase [Chloroflexota bacterium]